MAESDLNKRVMAALTGFDPQRVENAVGPGTPDIEYIGGWIEDKKLEAWPKRANTPVRVPHYTTQQRAWHSCRRRAGGRVFVVIEVARDAFVFDAAHAAGGLGYWTREEMHQHALLHMRPWDGKRFREFVVQCNRDRMI
jgi:hypothetical protein